MRNTEENSRGLRQRAPYMAVRRVARQHAHQHSVSDKSRRLLVTWNNSGLESGALFLTIFLTFSGKNTVSWALSATSFAPGAA